MTCMHLKKFNVSSSLRRSETHLRHAQGHQRAGAISCSINIFQNTINTVYEVESQKTVTTKLGKRTIWFSEVIKEFYRSIQEKLLGRQKKMESKVALHS